MRGNAWDHNPGDEPLMRCYSFIEALEGWKSICGQADNFRTKGKISIFISFSLHVEGLGFDSQLGWTQKPLQM